MAPTYAPTGGTQAPNPSRAVPAPRPPRVPGATREAAQDRREARQGTPGRNQGRNRPGGRTPAQHMRPGGRPPGGGRPAARTPERMSRNWLNWTPSQIQKFVADRTAESVRSERLPFQQQAGEIEGNARGAAQRLGQAGSWAQGQIGALQQGAEGSAKTFENQVADRAVSAQNAINEQRNQAEKSFGGPLTPGLAGQFVAEQGEAQQSGAAAQRAAGERTQGENNFMRQLREAAAMRATEGQGVVANQFAGQLGKTRAAERAQIGRTETRGQQEYPKMLQAQTNARLGLGKLSTAQEANLIRERGNIRNNQTRNVTNIRTTGTSAANTAARNATSEANTGARNVTSVRNTNRRADATERGQTLTRLSAAERNAITAGKSGTTKPMTPAQVLKVEGEMHNAFAEFKKLNPTGITAAQIRDALRTGGYRGTSGKLNKSSKVWDIFGKAAEEIWYFRSLSPETKAVFHSLGIPEKAWSNELLGAPKTPNQAAGVTGGTRAGGRARRR